MLRYIDWFNQYGINIVMVTKDVQPPEDADTVKKSQPSDHVS